VDLIVVNGEILFEEENLALLFSLCHLFNKNVLFLSNLPFNIPYLNNDGRSLVHRLSVP